MSWTERYLAVALRSIPEPKRADLERELRSSIADAVEERVAAGEERLAAERGVLEELGDPTQLAAAYTGRPAFLIGPELFPLYRRFVPRLVAIVVPLAAIGSMAVELARGGGLSAAISAGISGAISVGIQIAFWSTVTFVFLEWADSAREARSDIVAKTGRWTVDRLSDPSSGRIAASQTIGEIVTVLITLGILVLLRGVALTNTSGDEVPLFADTFTRVWYPLLLAVVGARTLVHLAAFLVGHWTTWLLVGYALLHLGSALPIVALALSGTLIDPAFAEQVGVPSLPSGNGVAMLAVAVGTALATSGEILRVFRRAQRTTRGQTVDPRPRSA